MPTEKRVGLPVKPFLYTLDQIAFLLAIEEKTLKQSYLHYDRRSVGAKPRDRMLAVDISPDDADKPDWRITERELIRWMKLKGFRYSERGWVS